MTNKKTKSPRTGGDTLSRAEFLRVRRKESPVAAPAIATERASLRAACPERSGRNHEAVVAVVLRDALSQRPLRFRPVQFLVSEFSMT